MATFPSKGGKWQVSALGGTRPVWSRDGREIFYVARDNKLMSVDVKSGVQFEHGVPKVLFQTHMAHSGTYNVASDGKRFLMVNSPEPGVTQPMTVVVNWQSGLNR